MNKKAHKTERPAAPEQKCGPQEDDRNGKDEMNLAEFPAGLMTTQRGSQTVKTLRFQNAYGTLTVTGSDALGLPSAIDSDVLVALIELTKRKNNFEYAKVHFTVYELIQMLGWANVGTSYHRVKDSLNLWAGITLIYDGCWWDNARKKHISITTHIIDKIVYGDGKRLARQDGQRIPLSSFEWNDAFMESFRANNLKSLDTSYYFSLKYPTSKQLFRFLDKRFGSRGGGDWTFNLKTLAYEHVGLSRSYSAAKIKEKLAKALEELEQPIHPNDPDNRFLKPLPREERYFKEFGVWRIRLIDGREKNPQPAPDAATAAPPPEPAPQATVTPPAAEPPLVTELTGRGINVHTARQLVADYPEGKIRYTLELLDAKTPKQRGKIGSETGWIIAAIAAENGYAPPKGFKPQAQRKAEQAAQAAAEQQEAAKRQEQRQEAACQRKAGDYIARLSPSARAALVREVLAHAGIEERARYEKSAAGAFRDALMAAMMRAYLLAKWDKEKDRAAKA